MLPNYYITRHKSLKSMRSAVWSKCVEAAGDALFFFAPIRSTLTHQCAGRELRPVYCSGFY